MIPNHDLSCEAMTKLTDAWYNHLATSLNLSVHKFQWVQPPVIPNYDDILWSYFNVVPPPTLTYNRWYYEQPTFFSAYAAIVNQLVFPDSAFENNIGADNYAKWTLYLNGLPKPPATNTLPTVWFQWAILYAPSVANIGRSDLSYQILIHSGQSALAQYEGPDAKPVDFSPSLSDLQSTLQASPATGFSFNSLNLNPDLSASSRPIYDPCFFGLWTGSYAGFHVSKKFAGSSIAVSIRFEHFSVVTVTPGSWYHSSLLQLARTSKSTPPWTDPLLWEKYFGESGTLQHAIGSVLAVDGISLNLTADTDFTAEEQWAIKTQVEMGYWPLYYPQRPLAGTNTVTFEPGKMTIQIESKPGNPVILGANVLGINYYLGSS
jgi:hypothetical protein